LAYFEKIWLRPAYSGWYQGFAKNIPDHNNSNEADNRYTKEDQGRKRLGLIQFLNHCETNLISGWSKRRAEGSYDLVKFHETPQLSLKDWTNAWQWSSLNKDIIRYKRGGRDLYCMPGGLERKLSTRTISKYFNLVDELRYETFDEYVKDIHTINYVKFVKKDWITSVCSCVYWAKNYYCHHTIGVAAYKNKVSFLDEHKQIPIGQSRPRGQPKKTASALEHQNDQPISSSDSSDTTVDYPDDPSPKKLMRKVKKKGSEKPTSTQKLKKRGRPPKK